MMNDIVHKKNCVPSNGQKVASIFTLLKAKNIEITNILCILKN